jgi:hypothetical protein
MEFKITPERRSPLLLVYILIFLGLTTNTTTAPISGDDGVVFTTGDKLITRSPKLGKRLFGTCIDMCQDPNYVNCHTLCTDADACTNLAGPFLQNGVSSINFQGSTRCWVFDKPNCVGDSRSLPVNQPNMAGSAFDDQTRSFYCDRPNKKRDIEAPSPEISNTALLDSRISIATQDTPRLGTCIDMCQDYNFGSCYTICTNADTMTNLGTAFDQRGVSSINFKGSTECWLFDHDNPGPDVQVDIVYVKSANPDLRKIGWDKRAKIFLCDRLN